MPFPALAAVAASPVVASLVGSAVNAVSTSFTNKSNIAAQQAVNQQNLDYSRQMTQAQWERDDTAHQREVADLIAAGLSPLASTNGSAVTPAQTYQGSAYQSQAPQMDVNSLVQSILASQQLNENKRQFNEKMIREDKSLVIRSDELKATLRGLDIQSQEVLNQAQKISNDYLVACNNVNLGYQQLKETQDYHKKQLILEREAQNAKMINDSMRSAFGSGFNSVPVFNYDDYVAKLDKWGSEWNTFLQTKLSKEGSVSRGQSSSKGSSSGGSGSVGIFGLGNVGLSASKSKSDASSSSASATVNDNYEKALIREFTAHHPYPIFVHSVKGY